MDVGFALWKESPSYAGGRRFQAGRKHSRGEGAGATMTFCTIRMKRSARGSPVSCTTIQADSHRACLSVSRRKSGAGLCQNCVTYPLKPPVNTVIYEDTSTRIDVAELVG